MYQTTSPPHDTLLQLEQEWETQQQQYLVRGRYRLMPPSSFQGYFLLIFSTAALSAGAWYSNTVYHARGICPAFLAGLVYTVFSGFGIHRGMQHLQRVGPYQRALAEYEQQRELLRARQRKNPR